MGDDKVWLGRNRGVSVAGGRGAGISRQADRCEVILGHTGKGWRTGVDIVPVGKLIGGRCAGDQGARSQESKGRKTTSTPTHRHGGHPKPLKLHPRFPHLRPFLAS